MDAAVRGCRQQRRHRTCLGVGDNVSGSNCYFCQNVGGTLIFQHPRLRVIRADDEADFPALYRVVWSQHAPEFSDLSADEQALCMQAVVCVEQSLRRQLQPTKINLAAFGNMVPHLHWHVIARFAWDSHFPAPMWAKAKRTAPFERLQALRQGRTALETDMARALQTSFNPT